MPAASTVQLILASASPRRSALLSQIGVAHRCIPAAIDEKRLPHELPEQCVRRLAQLKAEHVHARRPGEAGTFAVLAADTAVLLDADLLGKPRDRAHALQMLQRLSGRTHRVLCAVALASAGGSNVLLSESDVGFRELSHEECAAYWDSGEPHDKAGGYAIQGLGAVFVARLRGSYSAVMGLPLFETARLLRAAGVRCWDGALR